MEKWVEEQKENKRRKADADREQQIYTKMKFKKNWSKNKDFKAVTNGKQKRTNEKKIKIKHSYLYTKPVKEYATYTRNIRLNRLR